MAKKKQAKVNASLGRRKSGGKNRRAAHGRVWLTGEYRDWEPGVGDAVKFRGKRITGEVISVDDDGFTSAASVGVRIERGGKTCVRYADRAELLPLTSQV